MGTKFPPRSQPGTSLAASDPLVLSNGTPGCSVESRQVHKILVMLPTGKKTIHGVKRPYRSGRGKLTPYQVTRDAGNPPCPLPLLGKMAEQNKRKITLSPHGRRSWEGLSFWRHLVLETLFWTEGEGTTGTALVCFIRHLGCSFYLESLCILNS